MNFSPENSISVDHVMSDIMRKVGDEDHLLFPPGYYVHLIQFALEQLSIDTLLLEFHKDFDFPKETLQIKMPLGAFNLSDVFLWSGDCCSVESQQNVYYKSGYKTDGADRGYTAMNKNTTTDEYFIEGFRRSDDVYFFTVQNGYVTLSSKCIGYEKVRLVYNGVATNIGDTPIIPLPFRQAVIYWVCCEVFNTLWMRTGNQRYRLMYKDLYNDLYSKFDGAWDKALARSRKLDTKVKKDYTEYLSKMNY